MPASLRENLIKFGGPMWATVPTLQQLICAINYHSKGLTDHVQIHRFQ